MKLWALVVLMTAVGATQALPVAPPPSFAHATFTGNTSGVVYAMSEATSWGTVRIPRGGASVGALETAEAWPVRGFETHFWLNISRTATGNGHDGLAFVVKHDASPYADNGAGLGYADQTPSGTAGLRYSLAIEFDTFKDTEMLDPNANHISVHSLGAEPNSALEAPPVRVCDPATSIPPLDTAGGLGVRVRYQPPFAWEAGADSKGTLWVFLDLIESPVITCDQYRLETLFGAFDGMATMGFTGSGVNGAVDDQQIGAWSYRFLGQPTANTSIAQGAGMGVGGTVTVGENTTFSVTVNDQFGFVWAADAGDLGVSFSGAVQPLFAPVVAFDASTGTFTVTWQSHVSGTADMMVTLNGAAIKDAPFHVPVHPGPAVPLTSHVTDVLPTTATAGTHTTVHVQLCDVYGNNATTADAALAVSLGAQQSALVFDHATAVGDGLYRLTFGIDRAAQYGVIVTLNGEGITGGAQHTLTVIHAAAVANATLLSGSVHGGTVGETLEIVLGVRDRFHNPVSPPDVTWSVAWAYAAKDTPAPVVGSGSGNNATLRYHAVRAGPYGLRLLMDGAPVAAGDGIIKLTLVSTNVPDASLSRPAGDWQDGGVVGTHQASIQLRDQFNNIVDDRGVRSFVYNATLEGAAVPFLGHPVYSGNGTYSQSYDWKVAGVYEVWAFVNGAQIAGSPYRVPLEAGPASAGASTAAGDGLDDSVVGGNRTVAVTVRDADGNPVLVTDGVTVACAVTPPDGVHVPALVFTYTGTGGVWSARYTWTAAGTYTLAPSVNGDAVGAPVTVTLTHGPVSASHSHVIPGTALVGGPAGPKSWQVEAKDVFGNPIVSASAAALNTSVVFSPQDSPARDIKTTVTPPVAGSLVFTVSFDIDQIGVYRVSGSLGGASLPGSPWVVHTSATRGYGPTSTAEGAHLGSAATGEAISFWITVRDRYGNVDVLGNSNVTALVTGPQTRVPGVAVHPDGRYGGTFSVSKTGVYHLALTVNGEAIHGSPFEIKVVWGHTLALVLGLVGGIAAIAVATVLVVWLRHRHVRKRGYVEIPLGPAASPAAADVINASP